MKIRIEFTTEEKVAIMNATNTPMAEDVSKTYEGNFGKAEYNKDDNLIDIELKTNFVKAFSKVITAVKNTVLSLISTIELFEDSWFERRETAEITRDEDEERIRIVKTIRKKNKLGLVLLVYFLFQLYIIIMKNNSGYNFY